MTVKEIKFGKVNRVYYTDGDDDKVLNCKDQPIKAFEDAMLELSQILAKHLQLGDRSARVRATGVRRKPDSKTGAMQYVISGVLQCCTNIHRVPMKTPVMTKPDLPDFWKTHKPEDSPFYLQDKEIELIGKVFDMGVDYISGTRATEPSLFDDQKEEAKK